MPMRPMFLNMFENCMCSGYEPNPSKLRNTPWTAANQQDVSRAYFHYYTSHFDQPHIRESFAQVHLDADAADVLEHVRELHVLRIRAEPIEAAEYVSPWTAANQQDVSHAYFHYYTSHFDQPHIRESFAQILNMFENCMCSGYEPNPSKLRNTLVLLAGCCCVGSVTSATIWISSL
jgi:hypothetical protein